MRIATSYHSAKSIVANWEEHETAWLSFAKNNSEHSQWSWTWVVSETKNIMLPKSWKVLLRSSVKHYLQQGLSRGYLTLKLTAKPEKGRVWSSDVLMLNSVPDELVKAFGDKGVKRSAQKKWTGLILELFTPMHQKHPGLAEHALIRCLDFNGSMLGFVSDASDPFVAPVWHAYELCAVNKHAVPLMEPCERAKQKELVLAVPGEIVELRCGVAKVLSDDEISERLGGVVRFSWTLDRLSVPAIPAMARKFKLGDGITEGERRAIPMSDLSSMLDAICGPKSDLSV